MGFGSYSATLRYTALHCGYTAFRLYGLLCLFIFLKYGVLGGNMGLALIPLHQIAFTIFRTGQIRSRSPEPYIGLKKIFF